MARGHSDEHETDFRADGLLGGPVVASAVTVQRELLLLWVDRDIRFLSNVICINMPSKQILIFH